MIERENKEMSVRRQCQVIALPLSSLYFKPLGVSVEDEILQAAIDRIYLQHPFYGSRRMAQTLRDAGYPVGRRHVRTLMRRMGIEAIYPRPKTSTAAKAHKKYPYLLRDLVINRPNQVWCADITYIKMGRGWAYCVAVMDWYSRRVLSWRLSNTMDDAFCVEALQEALDTHGKPEIFNTDQGAQFTGEAFTSTLLDKGIAISMDGRGRCMDNVFIERLWWSLKYEEVYLKTYGDLVEARLGIGTWIGFYNFKRPHSSLGGKTPAAIHGGVAA